MKNVKDLHDISEGYIPQKIGIDHFQAYEHHQRVLKRSWKSVCAAVNVSAAVAAMSVWACVVSGLLRPCEAGKVQYIAA